MESNETRLDGNAAAGLLEQIFAFEVTTARAVCSGCGHEYRVAEMNVYALEMGAIMRCPGCDTAMIRMSNLGSECWIDAAGMQTLRIQFPG